MVKLSDLHGSKTQTDNHSYTQEQEDLAKRTLSCKNYYDILEVDQTASDEDIKQAFKAKAKLLHPDKNRAPSAKDAMQALNYAYDILINSEKRQTYDWYNEQMKNNEEKEEAENDESDEDFEQYARDQWENIYRARREYNERFERQRQRQEELERRRVWIFIIFIAMPFVTFLIWLIPYGDGDFSSTRFITPKPNKAKYDYKDINIYVFELDTKTDYVYEQTTSLLKGVFYTKYDFDEKYEIGSLKRSNVETEVESAYANMLEQLCYKEKQYLLDKMNGLKGTEHGEGSPRYRKFQTKLRGKTKKCAIIIQIKNYLSSPTRQKSSLTRDPEVISFLETIDRLNMTELRQLSNSA